METIEQQSPVKVEAKELKVLTRDGKVIPFDATKIAIAITQAFADVEGQAAVASTRVHDIVQKLTTDVCNALACYIHTASPVHIESIQDQVELALMRKGLHKVTRSYVIYREDHRKRRESKSNQDNQDNKDKDDRQIDITLDDGRVAHLSSRYLREFIESACNNLKEVAIEPILDSTIKNLFNGATMHDLHQALLMTTRSLVEMEPNYSYVAARLLLNIISLEVAGRLQLVQISSYQDIKKQYSVAFVKSINYGIQVERLNPQLKSFDLELLGAALQPGRDLQFNYLGLKTLYDRYFLHQNNKRYELPQIFFMRIAMGLALKEANKEERAIEFYNLLSSFAFMNSTPTLFNSGTIRSQLSSCFLTTIPDHLHGIYSAISDNALLQKFAGGLGNDWTNVRALGAKIKGTNGESQGTIPFMVVANYTGIAVNQGGKRKGALCAYLETWHLDIEEFLELRKNTGDERRRTHDMNTANWVPDLFMQRVIENKDWTLFSPDEVPDLHDLYGDSFKQVYEQYEYQAHAGKIKKFKTISAVILWRKMLSMLFETGHPWITFKDACNLRSPQQHVGVIHSSNLCTEITLNTAEDEVAVCNLGSINLAEHVTDVGLNIDKLKNTIKTAIRMLDNVIDINYYSIPQTKKANFLHRPIGLGIMGFQDALYKLDISYASEQAVEFADYSMEHISYFAIEASSELAKERGAYSTFDGSLWSRGILPIDSIKLLAEKRGVQYLQQNTAYNSSNAKILNWDKLRNEIRKNGIRNSNVLAIAPTATIANICGVSQSIEPLYKNLFVKSNLSGEFTVINQYLVQDLKKLGIWDEVMISDLKYFNGSLRQINRIPMHIQQKYATAFEIDPKWLIEAASRRQKWIDQSQSLNLYLATPSGKQLEHLYRSAWLLGLKTTYYLRTLGASDVEKSTINRGTLNAVQPDIINKNLLNKNISDKKNTADLCAIEDEMCEACQ